LHINHRSRPQNFGPFAATHANQDSDLPKTCPERISSEPALNAESLILNAGKVVVGGHGRSRTDDKGFQLLLALPVSVDHWLF